MLRKKEIYIGIYSTARETSARAEDENGNLIGKALVQDTINIHVSIKHSWDIIKKVIFMALQDSHIHMNDPQYDIHVGLGIKNTELVEACIELKKLNDLFQTFVIDTDGSVLLRGSHQGDGAILIIDYGVVGNSIVSNRLTKIGGWGFPHADRGSIPWIGLEAIQLTIQWIDGFIEETPLLKEIYAYFNNDVSQLIKWAMYSRTDPKEYNFICYMVLACIAKQDKHAISLIRSTATQANMLYEKLLDKSGISAMPCCLYGQLVPHVTDYLSQLLLDNLTQPSGDGTDGALALARSEAGKDHPSPVIKQQYHHSKHSFTG